MLTSKHTPNGTSPHFDNARLEQVIAHYQTQGDAVSLSEIVKLTQDRALTLIRFHKTTRYLGENELLSDIHYKLLKAVDKFDPARGTAFTFLSHVVTWLCKSCEEKETKICQIVVQGNLIPIDTRKLPGLIP